MEVSSSARECTSACGGLSAIMVSKITFPIDPACGACGGPKPIASPPPTPEQPVQAAPTPAPSLAVPEPTTAPAQQGSQAADDEPVQGPPPSSAKMPSPPSPRPPRPPPSPPFMPMAPSPPPAALLAGLVNASSSGCGSDLGYGCSAMIGKLRVHWTYDAMDAPANPCTAAYSPTAHGKAVASELPASGPSGLVHMAIEAATGGYVSLGFTDAQDKMYPSDIVVGWVKDDGTGATGVSWQGRAVLPDRMYRAHAVCSNHSSIKS